MSDVQHTPGPWGVVNYDCGDFDYRDQNGPCPSIWASDDQDCAIIHWDGFKQRSWTSANGNQRQIEANARLIAAAPDMLAVLLDMFERGDVQIALAGNPIACDELEARARAAIAKATGAA